jgi:hypothetical protein
LTFQRKQIGRIYLLRWREPYASDVDTVLAELRAFRDELGYAPVYIGIVPADSVPPAPEVRKVMVSTMPIFSELCESVHLVMEGRGLKFSAQRSAAAAMFLIAGTRKIYVNDTLGAALTQVSLSAEDRRQVLDEGGSEGLVSST